MKRLMSHPFLAIAALCWCAFGRTFADGPLLPPGDKEPVLRVETGGPTSYVTALTFSADGKTLFAGGWDKVIRAWQLNEKGEFVADLGRSFRVPVGPGLDGAINALAVSEDGVWIACGGKGVFRRSAGFRQPGFMVPTAGAMDPEMRQDLGLIYVFNTRDKSVRLLRGHLGVVIALSFAPEHAAKPPLLVSAGQERQGEGPTALTAIRLWDADKGITLAQVSGLPDTGKARPQLAAWHTGARSNQVRVALPLDDGNLRIWDAENGSQGITTVRAAELNITAALAPSPDRAGSSRLLTADPGFNVARVHARDVAGITAPTDIVEAPLAVTVDSSYPRALGLASSQGNGKADMAVVVVRNPLKRDLYRLQLIEWNDAGFGTLRGEQLLWQGRAMQPVLACAPRGQHLAVAGNGDHEIRIFKVKDLLQPGVARDQRIRGLGSAWQHVAFASDGKNLALVVNRSPRGPLGAANPALNKDQGDILFDFAKRQVAAVDATWRIDAPSTAGWKITTSLVGPPNIPAQSFARFEIVHGASSKSIDLAKAQALSAYAFTPQTPASKTPLLAVATHDGNQPVLALINAATGEQIRQFTAHSDRIYALAFSADGRLLASVSEDQTACVWSLTDVDRVIGKRGRIAGLVVRQRQADLEVLDIQESSPAKGKLQVGELITGLVQNGALKPVPTPLAFYEAIFRTTPGQTVTLRCKSAGVERDVTVGVGQGVDERKPLFSLFIIPDDKNHKIEEAEWIGWNPVGPYEASSPRAERYLGWHFNTGDAKTPTRFLHAEAHHKEYYREGILQKLIDRGELGRVEASRLPRPGLVLWIEDNGESVAPVGQETLTVRHARVLLNLEILDRPLASLESLTWKLDDQPEQGIKLDGDGEKPFELPLELERGTHRLTVTARTADAPAEPTQQQLTLRYVPPAPRVELRGRSARVNVNEPTYEVAAAIYAGLSGEEVVVRTNYRNALDRILDPPERLMIDLQKPGAISRKVPLRPGSNFIEIVAVNRNAPDEEGDAEVDRQSVEVFYTKKASPPVFSLDSLTPLAGGAGEAKKIEEFKVAVVHAPRLRLEGRIEAGENLVEAERFWNKEEQGSSLTGFQPDRTKTLPLKEEINLEPGRQEFRIVARTAHSDKAERILAIEYRPLLPTPFLISPRSGQIIFGEKATHKLKLEGRISFPRDPRPYRLLLIHNDRETPLALTVTEATESLGGEVELVPGVNRIRVVVDNKWGMRTESNELEIRYARAPSILELKHVNLAGTSACNLNARVLTATLLMENSVRVEVNGQEMRPGKIVAGAFKDGVQSLSVEGMPFEAGIKQNQILLWVSNSEAECASPGRTTIDLARPLPPAEIEILEPAQNVNVQRPEIKIRVAVRSKSPIAKAELVVGSSRGSRRWPLDLKPVLPNGQGPDSLNAELDVPLFDEANNVWVETTNAGGINTTKPLVVSYIRPPFRLIVDSLELKNGAGQTLRPETGAGPLVFKESAESGLVRLKGHIDCLDAKTAERKEPISIRAFVNGFQQEKPVVFDKPADFPRNEWRFTADLVLSRNRDNHVCLDAPEQEAFHCSDFQVACRSPESRQRLHVLILSPREENPEQLKNRVLEAIQSQSKASGAQPTVFVDVHSQIVTGRMTMSGYVNTQLVKMRNQILQLNRIQAMNDVFVIYYQGGEAIKEKGNYLESYDVVQQKRWEDSGIPCELLFRLLAHTQGAHLLLLDVARAKVAPGGLKTSSRDRFEHWNEDYRNAQLNMGYLRYAWLGQGSQPVNAQLITALNKEFRKSPRLTHLFSLLNDVPGAIAKSDLVINKYVPSDLENLQLHSGD